MDARRRLGASGRRTGRRLALAVAAPLLLAAVGVLVSRSGADACAFDPSGPTLRSLLSSFFCHTSPAHLGANCAALGLAGWCASRPAQLAAMVTAGYLVGLGATVVCTTHPVAGASAGIAFALAASTLYRYRVGLVPLALWLLGELRGLSAPSETHVAHAAHLAAAAAGLAAGAAALIITRPSRSGRSGESRTPAGEGGSSMTSWRRISGL